MQLMPTWNLSSALPLRAGACVDLGALCIVAGKSCWVLCVDALVLSADGGVLDALSIATKVTGVRRCLGRQAAA